MQNILFNPGVILLYSFNGQFQKISIPIPRTAFRISEGEEEYSQIWNSEAWGGMKVWKSEGMGGFYRWDFWSRKCRVSSLKMLSLWTFKLIVEALFGINSNKRYGF